MDSITVYFEDGMLKEISPSKECNQYDLRYLVTDGILFDLENADDIKNIPIPNFSPVHFLPDISKSLDYVLKRKAGNLSQKGLDDLSIICLRKANQLMSKSPIHWSKTDYFKIVLELARKQKFEEAKVEKFYIEEHYFECYDHETLHKNVLQKCLENAKSLNTDLVEADSPPNCSHICALYKERIFSLSGKDHRFPAMTDEIWNCGLIFSPFLYGISKPRYCSEDEIIKFSNRPFIDNRSVKEINNYELFLKKSTLDSRKITDFLEYSQIKNLLSEYTPTSLKKYQEMKYYNTEIFQELMQVAEEAGIDIEL